MSEEGATAGELSALLSDDARSKLGIVLGNIDREPATDKYRTLRTTNRSMTRLLDQQGVEPLLKLAGFREGEESALVFPAEAPLEQLRSVLRAVQNTGDEATLQQPEDAVSAAAQPAEDQLRALPAAGQRVDSTNILVGLRVKRGPDWTYGDQDSGGAGKVLGWIAMDGTKEGDDASSAGWARVQWDSGSKNNYEIGADGNYCLSVVGSSGGRPSVGDTVKLTAGHRDHGDAADGPLDPGM